MTWLQFLSVLVVLAVGVLFVWRSSTPKTHVHDEHCGCGHDHAAAPNQKTSDH